MTSRRHFLQLVGGAGLSLAGCRPEQTTSTPALSEQANAGEATGPAPQVPANRVVVARDASAVQDAGIDRAKVSALLDSAMAALSPAKDAGAAWRALFRPSDVVAIKVNCLAGPPLSSHPDLVEPIVAALRQHVGLSERSTIVYDRDSGELAAAGFERGKGYRRLGTDEVGYDAEPTTVLQAGSCYSRIISEQATAILNVPVLKDHDLAGLSGALKNHFGSIHNPNKLHTDHCTPYVADVNCAPYIRDKHRLVVCDGLLTCYDGGPGYKPGTTIAYGAILVAVDPVAADAVAFSLIEALRKEHDLPPIAGSDRAPRYIEVAADGRHALGVADLGEIDLVEVT